VMPCFCGKRLVPFCLSLVILGMGKVGDRRLVLVLVFISSWHDVCRRKEEKGGVVEKRLDSKSSEGFKCLVTIRLRKCLVTRKEGLYPD